MNTYDIPFTSQAEKVLARAGAIAKEYGMSAVGTEHLLLAFFDVPCLPREVLKMKELSREKACEVLGRMLGDHFQLLPEGSAKKRGQLPFTPLLSLILEDARDLCADLGAPSVGTDHLFMALLHDVDGIASKVLFAIGADIYELEESLLDSMGEDRFAVEDLLSQPAGGPAETVAKYTRDLTALASSGKLDPVIGRDGELRRVLQILCRKTKNNPCLIGEPGVGKTAIVEALAQRISDGKVPRFLLGKRLLALDLAGVVAGTKYRGEFEERMKTIIDELYVHPEILLFIDEFHTLIGAGGAEGSLDAANILKPALSRGEVQVIGATTLDEYKKHVEKDAALKRRFQSVLVETPGEDETLAILKGRRSIFERHHRVLFDDEALESAVKLSGRYITDRIWPEKALDLIDEAGAAVRLAAPTDEVAAVTKEDIAKAVALWTGIPMEQLSKEEGSRLLGLESDLHRRVIGQEEAISALSKAIRRSRVGLKDPKRPIGSFLFLGPTGVGKTELTKALTASLFGDETSLIRIDMSEYMEKHSVSKIIGSPPGYVGFEEGGQLSEKVRRHPYSVILFDEIEKAHPDVFHILLQILDEGRLTDAQGKTVDFKNTVIVMTSNAGAERIIEPKKLGFASEENEAADYQRMKDNVMEEVKRLFRPEFINRIDEIIVFHSLTRDDIDKILDLQLHDIEARLSETHRLRLTLSDSARNYFIRKGYQPKYGARPLKRLLQNDLEDLLAEEILKGNIKDGDSVTVEESEGRISLRAETVG
ncbi:MAG: ATP-dependent Clp protease ATP-binding subunit [Lachnospiraceae bacterium]|nr:ATP-dependent Clp protease ATP-binding subunit [Lachnospiraceae bacterium]